MSDALKAVVYTDGSCLGNPGPGGWAAIVKVGDTVLSVSGGAPDTTNNRMELTAAIYGFSLLTKGCYDVDIYSDSQYMVHAFDRRWVDSWKRHGWTRSSGDLKNSDLWQILAEEASKHNCTWHWVKGHAGNQLNETADKMAVKSSTGIMKGDYNGDPIVTREDGTAIKLPQRYDRLGRSYPAGSETDSPGYDMGPSLFDSAAELDTLADGLPPGEPPAELGDRGAGYADDPAAMAPVQSLGASDVYLMQMLMEMQGVKECGLLRPCENYAWCAFCKDIHGACACADAFMTYRGAAVK